MDDVSRVRRTSRVGARRDAVRGPKAARTWVTPSRCIPVPRRTRRRTARSPGWGQQPPSGPPAGPAAAADRAVPGLRLPAALPAAAGAAAGLVGQHLPVPGLGVAGDDRARPRRRDARRRDHQPGGLALDEQQRRRPGAGDRHRQRRRRPADADNGSVAAVAAKLLPSTVQIQAKGGADGTTKGGATGSGLRARQARTTSSPTTTWWPTPPVPASSRSSTRTARSTPRRSSAAARSTTSRCST